MNHFKNSFYLLKETSSITADMHFLPTHATKRNENKRMTERRFDGLAAEVRQGRIEPMRYLIGLPYSLFSFIYLLFPTNFIHNLCINENK